MGRLSSRRSVLFIGACATLVMTAGAGFPARAQTCELYPIALNARTLDGIQPGMVIKDIFNGTQPGNFGWLTWTGDGGTQALLAGLTPPGSSSLYVNPLSPADSEVSIDDWVLGRPGLDDSSDVRAALESLEGLEITVPVWDTASGTGSNAGYHVSSFAVIQLIDFKLPKVDRVTARYIRSESCGTQVSVNQPPVANDDFYFLVELDSLYVDAPGVLGNDRDPEGSPLRAELVTQTSHGYFQLGANGAIYYRPDPGYVGIDIFTYVISDGSLRSNVATGTFSVRLIDDGSSTAAGGSATR